MSELDRKGLHYRVWIGAIIVVGIAGILWPSLLDLSSSLGAWITAGVVLLVCLLVPQVLSLFYRLSKKLLLSAKVLIWAIILGIIFFGVVLPCGLLIRLLGKDPMCRNRNLNVDSYRRISKAPDPTHMGRQF